MKIQIDKEAMTQCFKTAMQNLKTQTGMTVQECVEKQIAKPPLMIRHNRLIPLCKCASCGNDVLYAQKYCDACGQRLRVVV